MKQPKTNDEPGGLARQNAIYLAGTKGVKPSRPVSMEALEQKAREVMKPEAFGYLAGGAGSEDTMRANLDAFKRWRIVPRLLRDVSQRTLGVELLGQHFPAPVFLAPIGVQSILHPEAELAAARAARGAGLPFILSTAASRTIEQVAEAMGDAARWFQLYWPRDPEFALSLLKRAEKAGYGAIVVTLDTFLLAWRERDIQNAYLPFLYGEGLANYFSDPVFCKALKSLPKENPMEAILHFTRVFSNPALTWKDLAFLRTNTRLPILLKGILHPDDARQALDHGVDGIIVSNHGGRQIDGSVAALDALPRIHDAVGGRTIVLFDSGIRRGADVFKAIALGAKAVLLGRPYAYGLATGGEAGVRDVLANLLADLDLTLGLSGCASFGEVGRNCLVEDPGTNPEK